MGTLILAPAATFLSPLGDLLVFQRSALEGGELWRLLSGHFVHFSGNHLTWDLIVFAGLWVGLWSVTRSLHLGMLIFSSIAISLGVWAYSDLSTYGGLSGLCTTLYAALVIKVAQQNRGFLRWVTGFAYLGVLAKLTAEYASNTTIFATHSGWVPVPLAHLIGLLVGTAWPLTDPKRQVNGRRKLTAPLF
ncbi:MAG: rhombosortase [Acidobacteria bacterium]|nr:rhombosortase [Acidobacteriota bacterium]